MMKHLTVKNAVVFAIGGIAFLALNKRGYLPSFLTF